jgi:hypothetical protein
MSTITTKQLRENMPQVISDLRLGNSIRLSYRHKIIGVLQPVDAPSQALRRGSPEAIKQGLQSLRDILVPEAVRYDSHSIKEQLQELRSRKYS